MFPLPQPLDYVHFLINASGFRVTIGSSWHSLVSIRLRFYYFRKSACKLTFDKVLLFARLRFYTEKGMFKVPVYNDG